MKPYIINLPRIADNRGSLSIIENFKQIPFKIERSYWIYEVPGGEFRGSHAFKEQQELIIALSGSFDVVLSNGITEFKYTLNRSYYGLYVPKMYWRRLENFSTNSLAFILSDTKYDQNDYIRNFDEFINLQKNYEKS